MLHRPYLLRKLPKSGNEDPYARSKITAISCEPGDGYGFGSGKGNGRRSELTRVSSCSLMSQVSKKIISLERDMQAELPASRKKAFMYPFNTFDAAANLAIAVLQVSRSQLRG